MGVRLPGEYQEVEWIETAVGYSQYIRTDYISGSNPSAEFKFVLSKVGGGDKSVFGWFGDGSEQGFYFDIYSVSQAVYSATPSSRNRGQTRLTKDVIYEALLDSDGLTLNGEYFLPNSTGAENSPRPLSIFGVTPSNGTGIWWNTNNKAIRIYYLRIYNDNILEAQFIPCYRKSDSEIGMYDTVSKTFYTNAGTGAFLKGDDVSYEAIDWLGLRRMVMMGHKPEEPEPSQP